MSNTAIAERTPPVAAPVLENYVGGRWVAADGTETIEDRNPADGELIGRVPLSGRPDVDAAVAAARAALPGSRATSPLARARALFACAKCSTPTARSSPGWSPAIWARRLTTPSPTSGAESSPSRRPRPSPTCSRARTSRDWTNQSRYGNSAIIFTASGDATREFRYGIEAGMVGVNIGVAAPVAWFPFAGWKGSIDGDLHANGRDAIEFYTRKKVVTERWS